MNIKTKFFDEIECNKEDIIHFMYGLPGFQDYHDFVILNEDDQSPIYFMQSVDEKHLCFLITSPYSLVDQYTIDLSDEVVDNLKIEQEEDVAIYTILNTHSKDNRITANMICPLIVNTKNNLAGQGMIHNTHYQLRQSVYAT